MTGSNTGAAALLSAATAAAPLARAARRSATACARGGVAAKGLLVRGRESSAARPARGRRCLDSGQHRRISREQTLDRISREPCVLPLLDCGVGLQPAG